MKPKLLVVELWGVGDLAIATPFLQAASEKYDVTLLAKPYARDLQARFWPSVQTIPFIAPWTAFRRKYLLHTWPWREIFRLHKLHTERFEVGLSARWDPRDHLLLWLIRARMRLGFPRLRSQLFLTHPLARPDPVSHRYENWRALGRSLGLVLPPKEKIPVPAMRRTRNLLVHSGAGQPVRVWPLERYRSVVARLRSLGFHVQLACDPDQKTWWQQTGESGVVTPRTVSELFALMDQSSVFIGNDSGPAHLAAVCGLPTFILFGPQLPEWFAPLHPAGEFLEGKPCPYKPCSDYCRFPVAFCMVNTPEAEVWLRLVGFLDRNLGASRP